MRKYVNMGLEQCEMKNGDYSKQIAPNYGGDGMTLREHYAGLAMAALIAIPNWVSTHDGTAKEAVKMADALLAELEK